MGFDAPWHWVVLIIVLLLYGIPAYVAHQRHHARRGTITAVSLLLGWFPLVWLGMLIWAFVGQTDGGRLTAPQVSVSFPAGWYAAPGDPPGVLRYWNGTTWTPQTSQQPHE